MRSRTRQVVRSLPPERRDLLAAYRDGVNTGLEALGAPPFEYLLLRQRPAPWEIADSLLTVTAMFFLLTDEMGRREVRIEAFEEVVPEELARFLDPPGTAQDAPLIGPAFEVPPVPGPGLLAPLRETAAPLPMAGGPAPFSGSNSWAVAPERTAAGRPLVASDMHLPLGVPNVWYRTELRAPGSRFAGVTLPGVPALIAGSNGRTAWAFTNTGGDTSDLVELELHPEDPLRYRTPDGWRPMEVFEETIEVAGGEPRVLEVRETVWGPVTEAWGRPLAIRWIAHDPEAHRPDYLAFQRAEELEDLFEAGWTTGMPPQNLVAVDAEGAIGWSIAGPIPRRRGFTGRVPVSWAGRRPGLGRLPGPGGHPEAAESRIRADLDREQPPRGQPLVRPPRHRRGVCARGTGPNDPGPTVRGGGRRRGGDARHPVGRSGPPSWGPGGTCSSRSCAPRNLRRRPDAVALLEDDWTGRASPESAAYPLVRNARMRLFERIYLPLTRKVSERLPSFSPWFVSQWPGPLLRLARERPAHFLPPGAAGWDALLAEVLLETAAEMGAAGPLAEQTWGRINRVHLRHPLSPGLPGFLAELLGRRLDAAPRGLPGDTGLPRSQLGAHGATNRFVVSPGGEAQGIFHMPGGQAGHFLAPYYLAGQEDWEEGRPTPFLAGPAVWTLTLRPGP